MPTNKSRTNKSRRFSRVESSERLVVAMDEACGPMARTRGLRSGERLFRAGDRVSHFFVVTAGRIRLVRHTADA